jgi:hypothetical protein
VAVIEEVIRRIYIFYGADHTRLQGESYPFTGGSYPFTGFGDNVLKKQCVYQSYLSTGVI